MDIPGIFDKTLSTLQKNLDVRSRKHELIVGNVANKDTPHFKPFDFMVEEAMANLMTETENVSMKTTDPGHLSSSAGSSNTVMNDRTLNIKQKDEEVDIDKIMSDLSQNTIIYNASAQILSKKLSLLKDAISGGSR